MMTLCNLKMYGSVILTRFFIVKIIMTMVLCCNYVVANTFGDDQAKDKQCHTNQSKMVLARQCDQLPLRWYNQIFYTQKLMINSFFMRGFTNHCGWLTLNRLPSQHLSSELCPNNTFTVQQLWNLDKFKYLFVQLYPWVA